MLRRSLLAGLAATLRDNALLSPAGAAFLRDQARRAVAAARIPPGPVNRTPYSICVPGGNMGYPAFWIRDAVMMLGANLIAAPELEGWIRLIASTVPGPNAWTVRPGVVVPAYSIPDHINFNGLPTFYPGNYETGVKQGGPPFGHFPPIDDNFYFIHAVSRHAQLAGNTALFNATLKTSWTAMPLSTLCERVYATPPADPATGLCTAGDIETANAKDFGFCDTISKSGKLLFPSLLKWQAARQLATLFHNQPAKARHFTNEARRIQAALLPTFLRNGWLDSATIVGRQADVWGTALAVASGAIDARHATGLARAFRDRTAVRNGCVRHLLTTDGAWQVSAAKLGEYQNGGYWATPSGWYIAALAKTDRAAARAMAADYIAFLRDNLRPDGSAEAWEWFNPDTGRRANPSYVASVALPYISLIESSLI